MEIKLNINNEIHHLSVTPGETLLELIRKMGLYGAKHGCETGECGACTVLMDGKSVNSCLILAAQAQGHKIQTIESLGQHPDQGWKTTEGLHPLQLAFAANGAIQCGYCTPAQILAAKQLLDQNPDPTEEEVREAISGVLCRCTGYIKPVQAIIHAAAYLRGNQTGSITDQSSASFKSGYDTGSLINQSLPKVIQAKDVPEYERVGKPEVKVDAIKLVQGKPAFSADVDIKGMVVAHTPMRE
jgi:putative selenate reductase molybdopterin-binding subunit